MSKPHYASYQEKSGLSLLKVAGFVFIFGAFGGLIYYAASEKDTLSTADGSIPVIEAETGSVKVRAENPGGMTIPNRDKQIFDLLVEAPLKEKIKTEELCAGHSGAMACNKEIPAVQLLPDQKEQIEAKKQMDEKMASEQKQAGEILDLMAQKKTTPAVKKHVVEKTNAPVKKVDPVQKTVATKPQVAVKKDVVKIPTTPVIQHAARGKGWGVQLASYGSLQRANGRRDALS